MTKKQIIFCLLLFIFFIVVTYQFFFIQEIDISHNGFLGVECLKKLGFYDNDFYHYSGYWYSNGHLHPLYVRITDFYKKNFIIDFLLVIFLCIYAFKKSSKKVEISFHPFIMIITAFVGILNFLGLISIIIFAIAAEGTSITITTLFFYFSKFVLFILFELFFIKNRTKKIKTI